MRARVRPLSIAAGLAAAAALLVGAAAGPAAGATGSPRLAPAGIGRAPAPPAGSARIGALGGATGLHLEVVLSPRDPVALSDFVTAVSTPGSPLYHHYLRRSQFASRFGAAPETVGAVRTALQAQGLHPGPVSANGLSIPVDTTAAAASSSLHVGFSRFRLHGGRVAFANTAVPQLPASVAGAVRAVVGLDNLVIPHPHIRHVPHASVSAVPHAAARASAPTACAAAATSGGYVPSDFASAYSLNGLYGLGDLGQGITVALYELEPNNASDIAAYQSCFGTSTQVSYTRVDSGAGTGSGSGEAALDIEDVIGLAPQASISVYQGPNDNGSGPLDTYRRIITDDTAQVISTSWGLCEPDSSSSDLTAEHDLFQQAAAQGQTIVAAAGDSGSEDCYGDGSTPRNTGLAVDDPASQPYVTGVGGTTLQRSPRTETVWNEFARQEGAGGGGISSQWTLPSYQSTAAAGTSGRNVPDVSADADPETGYAVYYTCPSGSSPLTCTSGWQTIGGTSAAAPLWGAITALADASGLGNCSASSPLGFLNPSLYQVAGTAFTDITSGNNDYVTGGTGNYTAGTGYDRASGLGTPIAYTSTSQGLVPQLCATSTPSARSLAPTVSSISPASGPAAGGTAVTITGSRLSGPAPTVHFGSATATNVQVLDNAHIQATAPTGAGTVGVTVSNANGTSGAVSYTYVAPPAPPPSPAPSSGAATTSSGTPTPTTTTTTTGTNTSTPRPRTSSPTVHATRILVAVAGALRYRLQPTVRATLVRFVRDRRGALTRVSARVRVRGRRGGTATLVVALVKGRHGWSGSVSVTDRRGGLTRRFVLVGAPRRSRNGTVTATTRARVRRRVATLRLTLTPVTVRPSAVARAAARASTRSAFTL